MFSYFFKKRGLILALALSGLCTSAHADPVLQTGPVDLTAAASAKPGDFGFGMVELKVTDLHGPKGFKKQRAKVARLKVKDALKAGAAKGVSGTVK